jgi:hypothetical protein
MELLNQIGVETNWGFRTFELYQGDLMHMDWDVDVLVISSYERSYLPTPGTVVRALHEEHDLSVRKLAEEASLDYRDAFGCWLSRPLPDGPFQRILCVETPEGAPPSIAVEAAIENLFVMLSVMETKEYQVGSLAMPLLGAGSQRLRSELVLRNLLPSALDWLQRSRDLETISFVEIDSKRARALDEAMNDVLGRIDVTLQTDDVVGTVCSELTTQLHRLEKKSGDGKPQLIQELRHTLRKEQIRSYEIGILSRRMVEHILNDLAGSQSLSGALYKQIDQSADWGVASWVRSYMHVLRLFGNEAAHEKTKGSRHPPEMDASDLAICLFCLQRVVGFWEEARQKWGQAES